jgi:uncharacterized spore protein YtfJ
MAECVKDAAAQEAEGSAGGVSIRKIKLLWRKSLEMRCIKLTNRMENLLKELGDVHEELEIVHATLRSDWRSQPEHSDDDNLQEHEIEADIELRLQLDPELVVGDAE